MTLIERFKKELEKTYEVPVYISKTFEFKDKKEEILYEMDGFEITPPIWGLQYELEEVIIEKYVVGIVFTYDADCDDELIKATIEYAFPLRE